MKNCVKVYIFTVLSILKIEGNERNISRFNQYQINSKIKTITEDQILILKYSNCIINLTNNLRFMTGNIDSVQYCNSEDLKYSNTQFFIQSQGFEEKIHLKDILILTADSITVMINDKLYTGQYRIDTLNLKGKYSSIQKFEKRLYLVDIEKKDILGKIRNLMTFTLVSKIFKD